MNTLPAFVLYALASSITPGPNNLMLLASGANFGVRRTAPHALGVSVGFGVMVMIVGLGLGGLFLAQPALQLGLKIAGLAYILWLAWKIATAAPARGDVATSGAPLTFIQAALFQWVNVKAWMMAVGAVSVYTTPDGDPLRQVVVLSVVFTLVNLPSISVWVLFGVGIRRFLSDPRKLRVFNIVMALLLVASVAPLLI